MNPSSQIIIYKTPSGETKLDVRFDGDTVWLTQDQMASLFDKAKSTINEHIKNIFAENELVESSVIKKFGNSEFAKKPTNYYNLDVIISVGYRVKSVRGTQFRIWATQRLKVYQKHLEQKRELEKLDLRISPDFDEAINTLPKKHLRLSDDPK